VGRVVNVVKGRRLLGASLLVVLASLALSACELVELADDADSYKGPPFIKAPDGKEPTVLRYEEVAFSSRRMESSP
jgi:hypothetical protein